jgi:histidinol dehydrogenase
MASETLTMESGAQALARELRALVDAPESVSAEVAAILERVRRGGDAALRELIEQFDTKGSRPPSLRIPQEQLAAAEQALEETVREGLSAALRNVELVAAQNIGARSSRTGARTGGGEVLVREEPVHRAAVYVPAGRAPYPSTVIMGVGAARAAGVPEIVVCSPSGRGGLPSPVILGACAISGAHEVYCVGGAKAIAALAYGTETIAPVDVIVGPGNLYVQVAKSQVSQVVGIDGFAGPSDLMVIVEDDIQDLEPIALDLLAQAEHGPGTLVIGVSTSSGVLDRLGRELERAPDTGAVIRLVQAPSLEGALALAQAFAPEHLQLAGTEAEALAPRVTRSGCLFVGAEAGTAFGDYIVGSNHILPTNGSAHFASGLSAAQFRRRFAEVRIKDPGDLARLAAPVARAEGFELHARSMEARIGDNRPA